MSGNQDTRQNSSGDAPRVPAIPMSDANLGPDGQPTIGNLVKEASASASTLVRAEIALAKSELVTEAKKAGAGSGLLVVAGVLLLYTSIFFFVFAGVVLDIWLPAWAAWGIVFLFLLIVSVVMILFGVRLLKKLRAPEKTIDSVKELPNVVPGKHTPAGGFAHPQIPPARSKH